MTLPTYFDSCVTGQTLAWFLDPALARKHLAGENQGLSARSALRQTTHHKKKIGANPAQAAADKSSEAEWRHAPGSANSARNNRLFSA